VLRKNVRELGSRTSAYVEQCIKLERELVQQVRPRARAGALAAAGAADERVGAR